MTQRSRLSATLLAGAAVAAVSGARTMAGDAPRPLHLTVTPSGYTPDAPAETVDDMLARRMRQSDYLFRSICRGCVPREGDADGSTPFRPIDSLNAALSAK